MTLAIALLPSNQDRNRWANDLMTERDGMATLNEVLRKALTNAQYTVRSFVGKAESKDVSHLSGLIDQTKAAAAWLHEKYDEGYETLALHLHSDAVREASAIGIFDATKPGPNGLQFVKDMAVNLASVCASAHPAALRCVARRYDYRNYIFSSYGLPQATNILLETWSHSHLPSCEWFAAGGYNDLASAITSLISEVWLAKVWYCRETGFIVDDNYGFYSFVMGVGERHVELLGYPISDQLMDADMPVQWFERARLEYHQNDANQPIKLTRLGAMDWESRSKPSK